MLLSNNQILKILLLPLVYKMLKLLKHGQTNLSLKFLFGKCINRDQSGQTSVNFNRTEIPIKPCTQELIGVQELQAYFLKNDIQTQYCVDYQKIDHLYLEGQFDTTSFRYLEVQVASCRNSSVKANGPRCAPQKEIDFALNFSIFAFQFNDIGMDVQNFENPHKRVGKDIYTTVSNQIFKHIDLYLQPVITQTDTGYFSRDLVQEYGLKYNTHIERLDFIKLEDMFFRMMFRLDNKNWINQRQYIKITDIIGKIGGIWQVLFVLCLLVIRKVNLFSQKVILLNSIFNFEQQKKDTNQSDLKFPPNEDDKISMKNYFYIEKNKIQLSMKDYLGLFLNYFRCSKQFLKQFYKIIEFAAKKIERSLDIANIINKLNELDKLKNILLTKEQIQLFDYIDNPTISLNPDSKSQSDTNYKWSILKQTESSEVNCGVYASESLKVLLQKKDKISKNLIQMLNQDFMRFANQKDAKKFSVSSINQEKFFANIDERQNEDLPHYNLSNYPILNSPVPSSRPIR